MKKGSVCRVFAACMNIDIDAKTIQATKAFNLETDNAT